MECKVKVDRQTDNSQRIQGKGRQKPLQKKSCGLGGVMASELLAPDRRIMCAGNRN